MVDEGGRNSASQGVVVEEENHANPSNHMESEKGKSDNFGMVPDYVINVPEVSASVDMFMECKAPNCMGNRSQDLITLTKGNNEGTRLNVRGNGMEEGSAHVEKRACDRSKNSKSRPT